MIKEVKMFTLVCDNCVTDVNSNTDYSCWNNKEYVEDIAKEADWIKQGDNHYCPNCYKFDDDDNIILI